MHLCKCILQLFLNTYGYSRGTKQLAAAEMVEKLRNFTIISKERSLQG